MKTSIIILTCNQLELTKRCLGSIRKHTPEDHELIVVDNASSDGTAEYLKELSDITAVFNDENLGFAKGCNQGVGLSTGDNILFLNNDTVVTENWLGHMLRLLHSAEEIGMVGPVTNYSSGPQQIPVTYRDLEGLSDFTEEHCRRYAGRSRRFSRLTGFCLLVKRQVLNEIGLFDERYGLGSYEDDDLCLRAIKQGYSLMIAEDSFVHHVGHATFQNNGIDMAQIMQENKQKAREKWGGDIHDMLFAEDKKPGKITISLCMIVKNEEQTLARCLESVRGAVDEIVIVDTGSSDRTKEIARRFTERVEDFTWIDDFAAARNFAFTLATMDYIMWLDADDVLLPQEREKLHQLRQSFDPGLDAVSMEYHCAFDDSGNVTLNIRRYRLVRRSKGFRWHGVVHEDLEISGTVYDSDIVITHNREHGKTDRNLRIFEGLVERGIPLTINDLLHYAKELHLNEKYENAIQVYLQFLECEGISTEWKIFVCGTLADCYHHLGDYEKELDWSFKSFQYDLPRPQFCCRIGYHCLQKVELRQAIFWYKLAIQEKPANRWAEDNVPIRSWLPHTQLALCYYRLGEYEQSYRHNQLALVYRPNDEQILNNMQLCQELMGDKPQVNTKSMKPVTAATDKRFAVCALLFDCQQFILQMIENCGPFVEKIYIAYSELPWRYNPHAREGFRNTTDLEILRHSKYADKIELITGVWDWEHEQRNACLQRAKEDGIDFLIIQDADEYYTCSDYDRMIRQISENPEYDYYVTPWCTFWKTWDHILVNQSGSIIHGYLNAAVNCKKDLRFQQLRLLGPAATKVLRLDALCFHGSYVLSDEQVYRKINTWGHSQDFDREAWYQAKWLNWTESTEDLHPTHPPVWKRALPYRGELPEVLSSGHSVSINESSKIAYERLRLTAGLKLHLGCGERKIEGMVNCDVRRTSATDLVIDCTELKEFQDGSADLIFSNAFFEHLYTSQHLAHLKNCHRVLRDDGPLVYIGIPDFEIVADAYLRKLPGIVGDRFDLYHVYRYTHGDPEQTPDSWLQQLHKSLFDKTYITKLLDAAGFKSSTIFNYCYPGEDIPLCMGFVAWKAEPLQDIRNVLTPFQQYIGDLTDKGNMTEKGILVE
ncbi:glycosyltransferase [Paenibacillus gyeongsangnamensis]